MPEGDTIYRAARRMNAALAGKRITAFESVFPQLTRVHDDEPLVGRTVEKVDAIGKHLLIHFSGHLVLRTHLRMNGSWHIYRPGEAWFRSRRDMRITIETDDFVVVGFTIPVAEFLSAAELVRSRELQDLGPDLLSAAFDEPEAFRRLRVAPGLQIADALLNQRLMCGVGNVYKSEVLFVGRVDPFAFVAEIPDETLRELIAIARQLLRVNVVPDAAQGPHRGGRWTTGRLNPGERLWVYGRTGKACFRCGTAIESAKQGPDARLTFWCPVCQGPGP